MLHGCRNLLDRSQVATAGSHRSPLCLLTRLLRLTRTDEKRVADVPAIPAGEGPVIDDLGVHHDLDVHVEERDDLEVLELVVADPAQLRIVRLWIGDLQQLFPHAVDRVVLEPVPYALASVEPSDLRLHRLFRWDAAPDVPVRSPFPHLG